MTSLLRLPVNQTEKSNRIILYGAGENGLVVYMRIKAENLHNIAAVVDKNYDKIKNFPVKVMPPEYLKEQDNYDYIVITLVTKAVARAVKSDLLILGVPADKILPLDECFAYVKENTEVEETDKEGKLRIMLQLHGAIGDFLMSLKVYEEIVRLDPECIIDVFGDNKWFLKHIYFNLPNLGNCLKQYPEGSDWSKYDVVISAAFVPFIKKVNNKRVKKLAPELYKKIALYNRHEEENIVDLHVYQYRNRILLDRAKFLGLNRYTLFGYGGLFDITDSKVNLPVALWAEESYKKLNLRNPYITFNYGAANIMHDDKPSTKQWLPEYHKKLNIMLKQAYPGIEIIQLGDSGVNKIDGADRYILGENLEVVKYVLINALCHFDCDGGLVHIATQMGTKCFVVFGPTPVWFFGYDKNVNITPEICGECKGLIPDWYTRCFIGCSPPRCMESIKPERVFGLMAEFIDRAG